MKIVLFAPVEADMQDINSVKDGFSRYFEKEAVKAFACWRQNAGWLKDIPIYAVCSTKATLSEETRLKFRELNVTYVEAYLPITETYTCGFWNIPLVGQWAESNLNADVLIKIDLDMYLIRPLPESLFDNLEATVVGQHDHLAEMHLASISDQYPAFKYFFNTGFTISTPQSQFFDKQMEYLIRMEQDYQRLGTDGFREQYGPTITENTTRADTTAVEHRLMEEMCVSIMYRDGVPICPIQNYYLATANILNQLKYKKRLGGLVGYDYFMSLRDK